jgi:hypothetical protein
MSGAVNTTAKATETGSKGWMRAHGNSARLRPRLTDFESRRHRDRCGARDRAFPPNSNRPRSNRSTSPSRASPRHRWNPRPVPAKRCRSCRNGHVVKKPTSDHSAAYGGAVHGDRPIQILQARSVIPARRWAKGARPYGAARAAYPHRRGDRTKLLPCCGARCRLWH